MNEQSQAKSPEALRAMVAGTLANFQHPTLKHNLTTLKALHHVAWMDDTLHVELVMPFVWHSAFEELKEQCSAELLRITGAKAIDWKLSHNIATLKRVKNQPGINGVKNIIAVSSGKGGVGKSSTAVNLALALAAEGAKVGILDADIYGPSIPTMLGAENQRPTSPDGTHMAPIMSHGLATNSIGYLVTDDNAMVWRGPMASKALMQMLQETLWPDLDYLVLDMPPGTGDIQLTLAQNIPVTGAVTVVTMNRFSVPVVQRNWLKNTIHSCWGRCRYTSPYVRISIKVRQRLSAVRRANLPLSTASWLTALQLSSTGRVKSFQARFPSARSNAY